MAYILEAVLLAKCMSNEYWTLTHPMQGLFAASQYHINPTAGVHIQHQCIHTMTTLMDLMTQELGDIGHIRSMSRQRLLEGNPITQKRAVDRLHVYMLAYNLYRSLSIAVTILALATDGLCRNTAGMNHFANLGGELFVYMKCIGITIVQTLAL